MQLAQGQLVQGKRPSQCVSPECIGGVLSNSHSEVPN